MSLGVLTGDVCVNSPSLKAALTIGGGQACLAGRQVLAFSRIADFHCSYKDVVCIRFSRIVALNAKDMDDVIVSREIGRGDRDRLLEQVTCLINAN